METVIKIEPKSAKEKALWDKVVESFPKKMQERHLELEKSIKKYVESIPRPA